MLKRNIKITMSVLLLLLLSNCTYLEVEREPIADVPAAELPTKGISYGDEPENLLNVYLPEGSGPFPVLLLIHGTDMDRDYFEGTSTTDDLMENGFASVAIHYRESTPAAPLGPLQDATCALAWIYANREQYGFDTENIFLFGHSRGASLAALMSTQNDLLPLSEDCANKLPNTPVLQGTIAYGGTYGSPEISFSDPAFIGSVVQASGLSEEEVTKWLAVLSTIPPTQWESSSQVPELIRNLIQFLPVSELDGNESPFLLVHGENDQSIPVAESMFFAEALQNAGVQTTLAILPGMPHRVNQEALHEPLFKFLEETIKTPE